MKNASASAEPRFVVAGAVKAATTWTARQLAKHPRIFIPGPEPHYFSDEYHRGRDWYLSLFADAPAGAVIGEKSADYLAHPLAAERLGSQLPNARIIIQLRNPVDRAYSDYCMLFRRGETSLPPSAYFAPGALKDSKFCERFLNGGLYASHLGRIYDHFPREQVLVLLYDEISATPQNAMTRITDHIGVERLSIDLAATDRENDSASEMLPLGVRKALRPFKKAVKPLRGFFWFKALRGAFARRIAYPPLDPNARMFLADFYRQDVETLSGLIGAPLSQWLAAAGAAGDARSAA